MVFYTEDNNQLADKLRDSFANVYRSEFIYTLCKREQGRETKFLPSSVLERFRQNYIYSSSELTNYDLNSKLLDELKIFDGWFTEIIECLKSHECPQTDVISEMIRIYDEHKEKTSCSRSKGNEKSVTQSLAPTTLRGKKRKTVEVKKTKSPSLLKTVQDNKSSNNKCLCGNCPYSKRNKLCCFRIINTVSGRNPNENRNICMSRWKCIMNKVTNKKFLQKNHSEFFNSPPNTNRAYFRLACKFYIRQMYGVLGQGKGRLIPSCILNEIGKKFTC